MRGLVINVIVAGLCSSAAVVVAGEGEDCSLPEDQPSLLDLGSDTYKTFPGGLYGNGFNQRPPGHEAAGRAIADTIEPLNAGGDPAPNGAIVMISIGYSNMTQEWASGAVGEPLSQALTFRAKALDLQAEGIVSPRVRIVDGAIGGATAMLWAQPPGPDVHPWTAPLQRLEEAGLTRFQVQVVAIKTSNASPTNCIAADGSDLGSAGTAAAYFGDIARNLKVIFPNVKLAYFVTRSYGGYALTGLHPEPFAFEQGLAVKWIVSAQITGSPVYGNLDFIGPDAVAPWIAYGPYLWANGETPNAQGLSWSPEDFRPDDRTHPSGSGVDKAGDVFLRFFATDTTTREWFLTPAGLCPTDLDGDGETGFPDLLELLASWGPCVACPADLDRNGVVRFDDLLTLLSQWGVCPGVE